MRLYIVTNNDFIAVERGLKNAILKLFLADDNPDFIRLAKEHCTDIEKIKNTIKNGSKLYIKDVKF